MNRVLGTLLLFSCLFASISALRFRVSINRDCRNKAQTTKCRNWVIKGFCTSTYTVWMRKNCALSCGNCNCKDGHKSCVYWAGKGECKRNPKYMLPTCQKSCAVCTKKQIINLKPKPTAKVTPKPSTKPTTGCTDKHNANSCRYFSANGFCNANNNNWFNWMKSNCAQTCRLCPVPTTGTPSQPWFQIHSSGYNKCLALTYYTQRTAYRYLTKRIAIYLNDCFRRSSGQLWRWTSDGKLQSSLNQQCLSVTRVWRGYLGWTNSLSMQPCNSASSHQEWICTGGYLKLKNPDLYLVPYIYKMGRRTGGLRLNSRSQLTNSCLWTRYGTSKSICANEKATTTSPVITTNKPETTTIPPVTTILPPVTESTPPVPPTGDLGTPPPPPIGSQSPPPFPGKTTPAPLLPTTTKPPPPQGNKNIRCGTKGKVGGVVNGTVAAAGSWPWQVGIKRCAHCNITCGGTLINDEWVVTAAHCVSGWFPEELYLVLGEVDQSKKSGHEQRFRGEKILIHEEYAIDAPYDKDIALIRLDNYAEFNDHVRPLCMPGKGTALTDKHLCTVTGFGSVAQNAAKSIHLLQANVKVVPLKTCVQSYLKLLNPRKVTSNMLCAGYKHGGTDACQGDSGGPLTCFDRTRFRFILGGVVSWGVGCARPDLYGVYSNTALLTPWVEKKLAAYGY